MTTQTGITNFAGVERKPFYYVKPTRSENLLDSPVLLIYAQAIAMQMEIQIAFNEMKFNELSLQMCLLLQLDYNTSLLQRKIFYLSFTLTHSAKKIHFCRVCLFKLSEATLPAYLQVAKLRLQFLWNKKHQTVFERRKINTKGFHYKKKHTLHCSTAKTTDIDK